MTYDDPYRLRVLKAITAELETITVANGYKFDMAGKVFRGRLYYGEDTPVPFLSLIESNDQNTDASQYNPDGATYKKTSLYLLLQGFLAFDRDEMTDPTDSAHRLSADTSQCLSRVRARGYPKFLPGLQTITDVVIMPPVVRPADEISATTYFWQLLKLDMAEDLRNPYED